MFHDQKSGPLLRLFLLPETIETPLNPHPLAQQALPYTTYTATSHTDTSPSLPLSTASPLLSTVSGVP